MNCQDFLCMPHMFTSRWVSNICFCPSVAYNHFGREECKVSWKKSVFEKIQSKHIYCHYQANQSRKIYIMGTCIYHTITFNISVVTLFCFSNLLSLCTAMKDRDQEEISPGKFEVSSNSVLLQSLLFLAAHTITQCNPWHLTPR